MKCPECGTRIRRGEEVCSECGKYISEISETKTVDTPKKEVRIITDKKNKNYRYAKHLALPVILKGAMGLFFIAFTIYYMATSPRARFASSSLSSVLIILFGGFSIFSAIASIIQERNCFLCIDEEKVHGIIPKGTFETQEFEIPLSEIVYVEKADFGSRISNPKIIIITAEQRTEVRASSGTMLSEFCEDLKKATDK